MPEKRDRDKYEYDDINELICSLLKGDNYDDDYQREIYVNKYIFF